MRSRAVRKSQPLVTYFSFDLLFQNGRDLRPLPLIGRKKRLRKHHIESEGENHSGNLSFLTNAL